MAQSLYDIRPPVLRGESGSGRLQRYANSMAGGVSSCNETFPKSGLCIVTKGSSLSYKKAVETIGVYFIRELGFDIRPFTAGEYSNRIYHCPSECTTDENTRSFLWYNAQEGYPGYWPVFGACTFRLRGSLWVLQWIWMHPYERRKGHLRKAWPLFRSMFGLFVPDEPLSPGMIAFLRRMDYDKVLIAEAKRRRTGGSDSIR